jgi:hypothetical protein
MGVIEILATIDDEIAQLQRARAVLAGNAAQPAQRKPVRPKKAAPAKKAPVAAAKPAKKHKRKLSAKGRKRIAEAQKKRWATKTTAAAK